MYIKCVTIAHLKSITFMEAMTNVTLNPRKLDLGCGG